MKEALGELNKKQIDFICRECSIVNSGARAPLARSFSTTSTEK